MQSTLDPSYIAFANELADAARLVTLKYFRQPLQIHSKDDRSPVTIADQETEAKMKSMIVGRYPDHGFYGEESERIESNSKWMWVIDPIDGTTSFSTGKPTFGTLIALLYEEKPVLGIIDHAVTDDRWIGVKGQATTFNGEPVSCNEVDDLAGASAFTTTTRMFNESNMPRYQRLVDECKFGVFGADCMGYGLLASGFTEIVVEASLQPYDFLAVTPVVEGAGGVITDWQGNAITLQTSDEILASANRSLHDKALQYLKA
ncbi:MAG: inositol-phosphate phosphatase/L-galactose 1-phosphate phosphatase/histidinol-phosphatase [Saprospiraceae bacterium]|jgi:inositol-phosphate phosphatase/L-galactose 1-phosphate phosphatase/histidinol-phosphatase